MWVRGLKRIEITLCADLIVAPRVGAWIETFVTCTLMIYKFVAPRVGAWIETLTQKLLVSLVKVAPRVGAWIETIVKANALRLRMRRTPCGCVD